MRAFRKIVVTGDNLLVKPGTLLGLDFKQHNRKQSSVKQLQHGVYEAIAPLRFEKGAVLWIALKDLADEIGKFDEIDMPYGYQEAG